MSIQMKPMWLQTTAGVTRGVTSERDTLLLVCASNVIVAFMEYVKGVSDE
jgi:hypothetical protein